jgi:uncharacterized protein
MEGIWTAAWRGDTAEVQRLVGQDPGLLDARDPSGRTPLMLASQEGHVRVVQWLVDHGAALDERDRHKYTALWYACLGGHTAVAELLIEKGADPILGDEEGSTPLALAASAGHLEVVRLLLGHAATKRSINDRDTWGSTALVVGLLQGPWGDREGAARERGRPNPCRQ